MTELAPGTNEQFQWNLKRVEFRLDDRILVTVVDTWPEGKVDMIDAPRWFLGGREGLVGRWNFGDKLGWRVMDLARDDGKAVKWNHFVNLCRTEGWNHLPIYYDGAGCDAPGSLLDKGEVVAIRRFSKGPWIVIKSPALTLDRTAFHMRDLLELAPADATEEELVGYLVHHFPDANDGELLLVARAFILERDKEVTNELLGG